MVRENHHIDEVFKSELRNLEVNPPDSVWQDIKQNLDKKHKARILFYRISMAASFALLVGLGGLYIYRINNFTNNSNEIYSNNSQQSVKPGYNSDINANKNVDLAENSNSAITSINAGSDDNKTSNSDKSSFSNSKNEAFAALAEKNGSTGNTSTEESYLTTYENSEKLALINPKPCNRLENNNKKVPELIDENPVLKEVSAQPEQLIASNEIKPKIRRWSIEGQFAPQNSYRNLTSVSGTLDEKKEYNRNEGSLSAYALGLKLNYQATQRLTIQTGFAYSIIGQTQKDVNILGSSYTEAGLKNLPVNNVSLIESSYGTIVFEPDNDEVYNITFSDRSNQITYYNNIGNSQGDIMAYSSNNPGSGITHKITTIKLQNKVIEIPVLLRYRIIQKKIGWHVIGGLSANILLDPKIMEDNQEFTFNNARAKLIDQKPFNISGTMGFGLGYALNRRIRIHVEPTFKYYFKYIAQDEKFRSHPYSYAIYTGISYQF